MFFQPFFFRTVLYDLKMINCSIILSSAGGKQCQWWCRQLRYIHCRCCGWSYKSYKVLHTELFKGIQSIQTHSFYNFSILLYSGDHLLIMIFKKKKKKSTFIPSIVILEVLLKLRQKNPIFFKSSNTVFLKHSVSSLLMSNLLLA